MDNKYGELLAKKFPDDILGDDSCSYVFHIKEDKLKSAMSWLFDQGFDFLADISSVDYRQYFEVVYNLYRYEDGEQLTVKVKLDHDQPQIASLTDIWAIANWLEREVYDLMGIRFLGHPHLTRILLWEGFEGHPLRKDFEQGSVNQRMEVEVR
ncbi:MAG: NADH-quinone oxidoreductase subunit C [Clostridiales bacterium]